MLMALASSRKTLATLRTSTRSHLALAEVSAVSLPNPILVSGAYGEVRKCLHKETKALRAVKIINKKYLEEDEKDKL